MTDQNSAGTTGDDLMAEPLTLEDTDAIRRSRDYLHVHVRTHGPDAPIAIIDESALPGGFRWELLPSDLGRAFTAANRHTTADGMRALRAVDQLAEKLDHDEVRRLRSLMAELAYERGRQLAKWGDQRHPDGTSLKNDDWRDHVRGQCQRAAAEGRVAWAHILQEEFVEALAEVDPAKIRAELLQVAAVCAAWIGDIDRRDAAFAELHTGGDPAAQLHIDVTIEDGDQVSTWRCPVCKNTVSVRSELLDWARQQIARYAPHTDCQPPESQDPGNVHDDQADEAEACLGDYERGDDDPDLHP